METYYCYVDFSLKYLNELILSGYADSSDLAGFKKIQIFKGNWYKYLSCCI